MEEDAVMEWSSVTSNGHFAVDTCPFLCPEGRSERGGELPKRCMVLAEQVRQ